VSAPERILVIRLSALGDVLLATPTVRALARRFPRAEIDWLVEAPYVPLVAGARRARPWAYEKRGAHAGLSGLWKLRGELAARRYELVVDLQNKPKTALLRTVGRSTVVFRRRTTGQALQALVGRELPMTRAHAVELYLEACTRLGLTADDDGLELSLTEEMEREAAALRLEGRVAALAPGARWLTKRWPAERFVELGRALIERGFTPLLLGGPGDKAELEAVRAGLAAALPIPDTASLSVGGLAAAIARCSVVVAGDSGPVHIASALRVPVVALFGPTSELRWGPRSPGSEVVRLALPCSPCSNHGTASCPQGHLRCMKALEVAQVLAAVERVARGGSAGMGGS